MRKGRSRDVPRPSTARLRRSAQDDTWDSYAQDDTWDSYAQDGTLDCCAPDKGLGMDLQWNGQERIAASKDAVWAFINDPAKIASCLPDVQSTQVIDAHTFNATVGVALGPVRGKFQFKIALEPRRRQQSYGYEDQRRRPRQRRGSRCRRRPLDRRRSTTILDWKGTASLRGPIATIGGRVVDAQSQESDRDHI